MPHTLAVPRVRCSFYNYKGEKTIFQGYCATLYLCIIYSTLSKLIGYDIIFIDSTQPDTALIAHPSQGALGQDACHSRTAPVLHHAAAWSQQFCHKTFTLHRSA